MYIKLLLLRVFYRLDVFGFLSVEPLSRSTHPPTSGNYGLSDIIVALQWVKANIEHFGGNASSVTLWGHRAGGTLVTSLIGSRRAQGLFSRAWISSGSAHFPGKELAAAEKLNEPFLNNIRCKDAACLRRQSAEDLMDAVPENWYTGNVELPEPKDATSMDRKHEWLVLDGAILQQPALEIFAKDEALPVKVIMGATAHAGIPSRFKNPNTTLESAQIEKIVRESLLGTDRLHEEAIK